MNAKQQQTPPLDVEVGHRSGYHETGSEAQSLEDLSRKFDEIRRIIAEETVTIAQSAQRFEQQISNLASRVEQLETDGVTGGSRSFGGTSSPSTGGISRSGPSNSVVDYSAAAFQLGLLLWAMPRRGVLQWLPIVPGAMSLLDNKDDKSPLKAAAFPLAIGGVSAIGAGRVFK